MNIGIYALYWEEPSLIYIGRAINVLKRFNEHMSELLKRVHCNYKVQKTYDNYGKPSLILLEEATPDSLANLEQEWIQEFNSVQDGLNITNGGDGAGYGINNSASKYSKIQVLKAFSLLYKTRYSYSLISTKLNLPVHLLKEIAIGKRHSWLYSEYPKKYAQMLSNINSRVNSNSLDNKYAKVVLISPSGELHEVHNIKEFASLYSLNPGNLSSLISGRYSSTKGWRLYSKN